MHLRSIFIVAVATATVLFSSSTSMAIFCGGGCPTAYKACKIQLKAATNGCMLGCLEVFEADPEAPDAFTILEACRSGCRDDLDAGKLACSTGYSDCKLTCSSAAPACANYCGGLFYTCMTPVAAIGAACTAAAAGDSSDLLDCASDAATGIDACVNDPGTGFAPCLATLCTSVCGNSAVEAGEECDTGDTDNGDGCSQYCFFEDADDDGINDDGDGSGTVGDNPCTGGQTSGCDDNCRHTANADQADTDGDLTGNACDANCTGVGGATIGGGVYLGSVGIGNEMAGVALSACQPGNVCCTTTFADVNGTYVFGDLDPGDYTITSIPLGDATPGLDGPFTVAGNQSLNEDIVLQPYIALPPDVTVTNESIDSDGVPVVRPTADMVLTVDTCAGGSVTWSVYQFGVLLASGGGFVENPAGHFEVTILANSIPNIDRNFPIQFILDVTGCTFPDPDETITFDAYIDPSGFVRYLSGKAASGVTVTLYKGESVDGPWAIVPDQSTIMSPSNRTNPDTTDSSGHFGWDVVAGFYKVAAEASGCTVESESLIIPPAVTDLDLRFDCPCLGGPVDDCLVAAKSSLQVKDDADGDESKDSFSWKWLNGPATSLAQYGSPTTATDYAVCMYTGSDDANIAMSLPHTNLFWATSTKHKYGESLGLADGITKAQMTPSLVATSKLQVKAKGIYFPEPGLGSVALPVTVQLQRSDGGACFESVFTSGDIDVDTPTYLKASH